MRGRPLFEFLLFLLVWGAVLWPLQAITRSSGRSVAEQVRTEPEVAPVWVQLRFSEAPLSFRLYSGAALLWEENQPDYEQEQPLLFVWGEHAQGDLQLVAVWERSSRRATEIRVSPSAGGERRLTLWHDEQEIEELLLFP